MVRPGVWQSASKLSRAARLDVKQGVRRQRTARLSGDRDEYEKLRFPSREKQQNLASNMHSEGDWRWASSPGKTPDHRWGPKLGVPYHARDRKGNKYIGRNALTEQYLPNRGAMHHEAQHAMPKRNAYRFAEVTTDSKKLAREEARVDWLAATGNSRRPRAYTTRYAQEGFKNRISPKLNRPIPGLMGDQDPAAFGRAYRQTQDKMHSAGAKYGSGKKKAEEFLNQNYGYKTPPRHKRPETYWKPAVAGAGASAPVGLAAEHHNKKKKNQTQMAKSLMASQHSVFLR